jgi:hypothetical protein
VIPVSVVETENHGEKSNECMILKHRNFNMLDLLFGTWANNFMNDRWFRCPGTACRAINEYKHGLPSFWSPYSRLNQLRLSSHARRTSERGTKGEESH